MVGILLLAALLGGGVAGWLWWPRHVPRPAPVAVVASIPTPATALAPAPPPAAIATAPVFTIVTATEQQIREHAPAGMTVFRFAANPRILVLDFASLRQQGRMLNRVAALVEKAGLPHDRVLTDDELDAAIRAQGDTVETFYYGHDYSAAALARFFVLADRDHVELTGEEEKLRALLRQEDWFNPGVAGGLISLPAIGADDRVTAAARDAILRHELSHGEFFSNPNYAEYVRGFWFTALTAAERDGVRRFLGTQEYDTSIEELMYNEMQAYLMFTRDPHFFSPALARLTPARLAELQTRFLSGMPAGWLRDTLASYQDVTAASARLHPAGSASPQ